MTKPATRPETAATAGVGSKVSGPNTAEAQSRELEERNAAIADRSRDATVTAEREQAARTILAASPAADTGREQLLKQAPDYIFLQPGTATAWLSDPKGEYVMYRRADLASGSLDPRPSGVASNESPALAAREELLAKVHDIAIKAADNQDAAPEDLEKALKQIINTIESSG